MFDAKKTLIVVYKDELLMNQLKKLVETHDDSEGEVVGTKDSSINIVSWDEKVWLGNKKAGNIQGKILFLGDIKGTDKLIPVVDVKFDDCGVKYGWAGNQAVLFIDSDALTARARYDEFLHKLSVLPVPSFLKVEKEDMVAAGTNEVPVEDDCAEDAEKQEAVDGIKAAAIINVAKKAFETGVGVIGEVGNQVAAKSEELFRNKSLMKRQMLFYGVVNLYNNDLDAFMNQ